MAYERVKPTYMYIRVYSDCLWVGRSGDRIPVEKRFSAPVQTDPETHLTSCTISTGCLCLGQIGQGVALATDPHLGPRLKSRAMPLLPLWAFFACSRVNFTFTFTFIHIYNRAEQQAGLCHKNNFRNTV